MFNPQQSDRGRENVITIKVIKEYSEAVGMEMFFDVDERSVRKVK